MATPVQILDKYSFDEASHTYRDDADRIVPSVTQALDSVGFYDGLERANQDDVEYKRQIGHAVHKATQLIDQNKLDWTTVDERINGYLDAYASFMDETSFKPTLVESRRVVKIHGMPVGMTIDREGWIRYKNVLRLAVGELKCTAQDEEYWGIQMAGYDLGLGAPHPMGDEVNGATISGNALTEWHRAGRKRLRFAVQLKPNGRYKLYVYEDAAHYPLFISALSLTWWKVNNLRQYRNGFVR